MATNAKAKPKKPKSGAWDDVPPLPAVAEVWLCTEQVQLAIGATSLRKFREMVATGAFPQPDAFRL